jgi:hypothetical protein
VVIIGMKKIETAKAEAILIEKLPAIRHPPFPRHRPAESLQPMVAAWYLTKKAKRTALQGQWHQKKQKSIIRTREA